MLLVILLGVGASDLCAQLVVLVPKQSRLDSLSVRQLRKIFKGESIDESQPRPVQIVEYKPASEFFYRRLYGQSRYTIAKYWLRLIFSGERVIPPKSFSDPEKTCRYLCKTGNAISFLPVEIFERMKKKFPIKAVVIDKRTYRDIDYFFGKMYRVKR